MKLSAPEDWSKFEVSPLGVDPVWFRPAPRRASSSPIELLCVGRLVPAKGQHILLDAVEQLLERGFDVRLRLVGDGPDGTSLRSRCLSGPLAGHVVFDGPRNQDEVLELLRRANIFVLPSFAEGVPVALMEAMSMEIPCVSTRITGIPELIRDGQDGILVAPSDFNELADALQRLLEAPELRESLGRAGRLRVVEKYNLRPNVERLGVIFRRRLAAGGRV